MIDNVVFDSKFEDNDISVMNISDPHCKLYVGTRYNSFNVVKIGHLSNMLKDGSVSHDKGFT